MLQEQSDDSKRKFQGFELYTLRHTCLTRWLRTRTVFVELAAAVDLRRIKFHGLRHSAASMLIAQGAHSKAIQELCSTLRSN